MVMDSARFAQVVGTVVGRALNSAWTEPSTVVELAAAELVVAEVVARLAEPMKDSKLAWTGRVSRPRW